MSSLHYLSKLMKEYKSDGDDHFKKKEKSISKGLVFFNIQKLKIMILRNYP